MALFVVLEREQELASSIDGKSLSRASDIVEGLCTQLKVTPLMEFFSMNPTEIHFEEVGGIEITWHEEWFLARDGLRTVRALMAYLQQYQVTGVTERVLTDLRNFEVVLTQAEKRSIRWHLGIDD